VAIQKGQYREWNQVPTGLVSSSAIRRIITGNNLINDFESSWLKEDIYVRGRDVEDVEPEQEVPAAFHMA